MASGFDFYRAGTGILLDHDRYIVLSYHAVGTSSGYIDVQNYPHVGHPVLDAPSSAPSRWQGPSEALFDDLDISNISTDSREPPNPSYRLPFRAIWYP